MSEPGNPADGNARIVRWTEPSLPHDTARLAQAAKDEGHDFVLRFAAEWWSGVLRFDGPGECLFIAINGDRLAGISGICRDPYQEDPEVGRLRHVFVDRPFRGRGIAERLVRACLVQTGSHFRIIRLKTLNPGAARIYERLGFQRFAGGGERMTHWLSTGGQ